MGLLSKLKEIGSNMWAGVKTFASKVVETGKKVCSKVKEVCSNTWNKFSGKNTFDEAEKLYAEISQRYNKRRQEFEEEVDRCTQAIEMSIGSINQSKMKIKTDLFVKVKDRLSKLKEVNITEIFPETYFEYDKLTVDGLNSKERLYKIDFNAHPFKTAAQALLTLGFYTRKKAKETLLSVKDEEIKINCEIAKMDAETKKLQAIEESLNNINSYYTSMIDVYELLYLRLDNNVNFLYAQRLSSFARKIVGQAMSVSVLPIAQQKEIEAVVTASKILKAMVESDLSISSTKDHNAVTRYAKKIQTNSDEVAKRYEAA